MDKVEWEIVRADIAMEKARLKANGDWAKWEEFQASANRRIADLAASTGWRFDPPWQSRRRLAWPWGPREER